MLYRLPHYLTNVMPLHNLSTAHESAYRLGGLKALRAYVVAAGETRTVCPPCAGYGYTVHEPGTGHAVRQQDAHEGDRWDRCPVCDGWGRLTLCPPGAGYAMPLPTHVTDEQLEDLVPGFMPETVEARPPHAKHEPHPALWLPYTPAPASVRDRPASSGFL